jgi:hypothetical protein
MSNVHNIRIRGRLPYDIVQTGSTRVLGWFANMSSPSWGFHIEYGTQTYKPVPETNGKYTFYDFTIYGSEAIWEDDIVRFCIDLVKAGTEITEAFVEDIEFPVAEHSIMDLINIGDKFEKLMEEEHEKTEKEIDELIKTHKFVERKIGDGITEARLVKK